MNISTEHIPQCNQSERLADASGKIVDLMNENGCTWYTQCRPTSPIAMVGQRRILLLVQCRSIVFDAGPKLKQNRVIVRVGSDCHRGDTLSPERPLPG